MSAYKRPCRLSPRHSTATPHLVFRSIFDVTLITKSNRWPMPSTFMRGKNKCNATVGCSHPQGVPHVVTALLLTTALCNAPVVNTFIINRTNKTKTYPKKVENGAVLQFEVTHVVLSYREYATLKQFDMSCCPVHIYSPLCPILSNFGVLMAKEPAGNQSFALNLVWNRQVGKTWPKLDSLAEIAVTQKAELIFRYLCSWTWF